MLSTWLPYLTSFDVMPETTSDNEHKLHNADICTH